MATSSSSSEPRAAKAQAASFGVCITTRHRTDLLEQCLEHIEKSTVQPARVVVSDDSSKPEMIEQTKAVVAKFPRAIYVQGPRTGVCANRNNTLKYVGDVEYIAFLDDDALVRPEYFSRALEVFDGLTPARRERTIVSGVRFDLSGGRTVQCKLSFRGYFVQTDKTEVAGASYAVYPRAFFDNHKWDEKIYFGFEDAELSLRALADGYEIVHREDMIMTDAGLDQSSLLKEGDKVSAYDFSGEAARLYIGVKRFKDIERDYRKLALFVPVFFAQVTYSLAKRRALSRMGELVKLSRVKELIVEKH